MMAFVMPANMTLDQMPQPSDGAVNVRQIEEGRFAVMGFSGRTSDRMERDTHK